MKWAQEMRTSYCVLGIRYRTLAALMFNVMTIVNDEGRNGNDSELAAVLFVTLHSTYGAGRPQSLQ
jgi:hypothetical protein